MPSVTYISAAGVSQEVTLPVGSSVMQGAVDNRIPGILGECGGNCMCATCHVYVEETFLSRLPAMKPSESAMLDIAAAERKPNSRLSCQIKMTEELEGIVVHTPQKQR